jgi:hypothetical protein
LSKPVAKDDHAAKVGAAWGAVPARAAGDNRLHGSHFRALVAIAAHDRLSDERGKGAGCYASNKTLSAKCGINYANFSTVVNQLGMWGYIKSAPHPISRRTRVYRVIYDSNDALPTDKPLPTDEPSQPGKTVDDALPVGKQDAQIVCPAIEQAHEIAALPDDNYIPLNGNRFSETEKDSAEAAELKPRDTGPLTIGPGLRTIASVSNAGAFLAITERALKDGGNLDIWTKVQIERITADFHTDDPNYQRAVRLLEQYGGAA